MRIVVVALALLLALTAQCAVTVSDTIYTPFNGVRFSGDITITGSNMNTADGRTVAKWSITKHVFDGVFSTELEPTDVGAVSAPYTVVYTPGQRGTAGWSETWAIPSSVTPLKINQVRRSANFASVPLFSVSSLSRSGANVGDSLTFNGTSWGPSSTANYYSQMFADSVEVLIPAYTHGFYTPNLLVACYDGATPSNAVDADISVDVTTYEVVVRFANALTGRCVVTGTAHGSSPFYVKYFTATTLVSIPSSEHLTVTPRLMVQCYDSRSPAHQVDGLVQLNVETFDVTVNFAVAQSGSCVVGGR